jgi:hypothetical protein
MTAPIPSLADLLEPDPELPDTSYRPFKAPRSEHVRALAEAKTRAAQLADRPGASRFLLLREDGTEVRSFDDLPDARAWQRASWRYYVVIAEDGRLMSFPNMTTEAFAEGVAAKWRGRRVAEEPWSEVRLRTSEQEIAKCPT